MRSLPCGAQLRLRTCSTLVITVGSYLAVIFFVFLAEKKDIEWDKCSISRNTAIIKKDDQIDQWAARPTERDSGEPRRQLVFAGVMTAEKYLDNRAVSVYRTWGQSVPGRVVFFGGDSAKPPEPGFPLVFLPGVDDSYPPQKKSFLMLKYMHDHFLNDYEWFMRADDDVYVRGDRLEKFLVSLNSSKPLFIGQAGMGNKEEFGMLSLAQGENFCMGGPGIIMSRETLRLVAPNIQYCLKHLYSTHEDVEIGRCIRKFAGVSCAWSYEMQTIFYHNQSGAAAFSGDLHVKEVHRAITLHPVKTSQHLHRIQNYYAAQSLALLHHEILLLRREIHDMNEFLDLKSEMAFSTANVYQNMPLLNRFHPRAPDEVLEWEFFTKSFFSHHDYNPKRALKTSLKWSLNDLVMQLMDAINQYSKQRGRIIDFKDLLYGYQRLDPLHGVQYVLDLHLVYKRYSGRKMTAPVRRHAYLEQVFSWMEMTEETECVGHQPTVFDLKRDFSEVLRYYSEKPGKPQDLDRRDESCAKSASPKTINLIVPLSGRVATLLRFLDLLDENFFSQGEALSLTVVDFPDQTNASERILLNTVMGNVKRKYDNYLVTLIELDGNFSRAAALQTGLRRFSPEDLLFFVDVDMAFGRGFLDRIRQNTRLNRMVFYPIVFSQYAPGENGRSSPSDAFWFTEENGYWRQFGYGIVSCYRADFDSVGGFDLDIRGWGKEDVDLFEKFIQLSQRNSRFEVFRSADPGLVHVYHPISCDPSLEAGQLLMCRGSQTASMSGQQVLTRTLLANAHWLNSNPSSVM